MNDNDVPQNILKTEIDTEKPLVEELAKVSLNTDIEAEKIWSWAWIFTAFVIGILIGGLGVWILKSPSTSTATSQTKPTPTVATTPTPTPETKIERKDLKIRVLNGSGVAGAASKAKELLENLGYVDVATGNADEDNSGQTLLSVKASKKDAVNLVRDDLATKYKVSEQVEELADTAEFDVVITLGKK